MTSPTGTSSGLWNACAGFLRSRLRTQFQMARSSRTASDIAASFGLRLLQIVLLLMVEIALARLLGSSGFGLYSYAIAWALLLALPQSGLATLVLRETARGIAGTDAGIVRGIWSWSNRIVGLYAALLTAAGLATLAAVGPHDLPPKLRLVLLSLPLVPLLGLTYVRGASLRGLGQVVPGQIVELLLVPVLFLVFLGLSAFWSGAGLPPERAIAAYLVAAVLAVVAGHLMLSRHTPEAARNAPPRWHSEAWLRSLGPLAGLAFLGTLNVQINAVILGAFHPAEEVGFYRVAMQMANLATFGLIAVNAVLPPQFASAHTRGDIPRLQRLARLSATVSFLFAAATTLLFLLFGRTLLELAFGPPLAKAQIPLLILLTAQLVNAGCGSVGFLLTMTGHERDALLALLTAAAAGLTISCATIPSFGLPAAAVAASASLVIWNVMMLVFARRRLGLNPFPLVGLRKWTNVAP